MKKMIVAIAAMMITASATAQEVNQPQPQQGAPRQFDRTEMIKQRTDDAVKKYGLNEEQAKQLLATNTKYADKLPMMRGFRGGPGGGKRGPGFGGGQRGGGNFGGGFGGDTRERPRMRDGQRPQLTEEQRAQFEERRKQQEAASKEYDAELQKIFTPEQYKAYKADSERQRPRMRDGQRGERPRNREQ